MLIPTPAHPDIITLIKKEQNARMKLKLLAVLHFKEGKSRYQIARYLKVSRASVNQWISKYLADGLEGLKEKKHTGRPAALSPEQLEQLTTYLNWRLNNTYTEQLRGSEIQAYILLSFSVEYEISTIYRLLKRLGYSLSAN